MKLFVRTFVEFYNISLLCKRELNFLKVKNRRNLITHI